MGALLPHALLMFDIPGEWVLWESFPRSPSDLVLIKLRVLEMKGENVRILPGHMELWNLFSLLSLMSVQRTRE